MGNKAILMLVSFPYVLLLSVMGRPSIPRKVDGSTVTVLQTAEAKHETLTLITLHAKDAAAADVYEEVARQANVHFVPMSDSLRSQLPHLTVDVEQQPFYEVLHQLAAQTGLMPATDPFRREFRLSVRADWAKAPSSFNNGMLFVADAAILTQTSNYTGRVQIQGGITLYISAYIDPKIDVMQATALNVDEAVDENGRSLKPYVQSGVGNLGSFAGSFGLNARFYYSPEVGKRIAHLKGSIRFAICTKRETWEVADIQSAKEVLRKLPSGTYIVKSLDGDGINPLTYDLKAQIQGIASSTNPLFSYDVILASLRLVDASGQAFVRGGSAGGTGNGGAREYHVGFRRQGDAGQILGSPSKLIWDIPIETRDLIVPLELKDLPLPVTSNNR